ncbi:proline-rich protein 36-like isoform X2 [Acanthaster planci]|uniref:Proline-rich protein 36-like isoform X2 n=1 Tax=Acanthaster planci TaxID=133434 RepID=A0A8B7ZBJ5_ACAPL|nr:proline-rich protein 36-like isoform X2 [Acanthaster planci]
MAAAEKVVIKRSKSREQSEPDETSYRSNEIEKKALWLKTKLKEGPVDGPSSLRTYREDIRQILFKEFHSPISDLEIGVVVRQAFPRHSRKGKYYLGIGTCDAEDADGACRKITTDNPKSLMTVQSDGDSREPSPVMLKPVKKRAIQEWKETENGQAFAADQLIRDANNQPSAPAVSVAPSDGLVEPPWRPMLMLPQPLPMSPRGMLFPSGQLTVNLSRNLAPSRARKRPSTDLQVGGLHKMGYGAERVGKKPRKEGAMIELSSSRNGLIADRTKLPAKHIQPIILDFDVTPPKLPLRVPSPVSSGASLDQANANESSAAKERSKSEETSDGKKDRMPVSPHSADSAESSHSKPEDSPNKLLQVPSSDPGNSPDSKRSLDNKSPHPFKKPDIDSYRNNVSAGRCFMCQSPIPPNSSKDASQQESAILSICMKCKKVAMSGSTSLKPVPKFPLACNPTLAPRTVYVPPPRRQTRPRPPAPTGPQKAVGIRLYPPRSRSKSSSSQRSTPVQSPLAPPSSPGQMSMPGSPAPSLPMGSPQPMSPAIIMHSAPPSPRHPSDAGLKMSRSLPPSPSMIHQHPASPAAPDAREPDCSKKLLPSASLQVPSPYSSNPSTPGGRDSSSSEKLSLPPGREQDDATIKALLQLGRGFERAPSEHSTDSTPVPSPTSRPPEKDSLPMPNPTNSIPIPHSPTSIHIPHVAMPGSLPHLAGQVPMIPSNAGVVMGPEGQLLPIIPSWAPLGVPTSEALNILSHGCSPVPLLIQQPMTQESSSPIVSVATLDPASSGIRSRTLPEPSKTNAGLVLDSHTQDLSTLKYRKGLKRSRVLERNTDSPRADPTHEDKSKPPIVIVGTNCAGSTSVKLKNNSREPLYPQEPVSRELPGMYGKLFTAFCCRCSGREIMLLQCPDCDFVCNTKCGMEQHIAAQRHMESHGKGSMLEAMTRQANEADDRDEIGSQSSVETQSADTDPDAASPPPTRIPREVPWARITDPTSQVPVPLWQNNLLNVMPERGIPVETTPPRPSQAKFVVSSSFGSFGTVTENTVPLDLSGRTFHPAPYFPFELKEPRRESSAEESSPLDLSGYSRPSIMSTEGNGSLHPFLSSRKLGPQAGITPKKTPLDLMSSQQPSTAPGLIVASPSIKKCPQPPVPHTFFDLMRLHGMPVPTTAMMPTLNPSKGLQSSSSSKLPTGRPPPDPSLLSVARTQPDNPSSSKSSPIIPSIVLSSSSSTSPYVSKALSYPTTELTRPPPGVITSPILTKPQSLNFQGGTISIRPTIPLPQALVSSKTVPVLSPFLPPGSGPASASETRTSPGREFPHMDLLSVSVGSPKVNVGSPSRISPSVRESPKARHRHNALESPREYSGRKDPSPVRSPQQVHIKIEPPDSLQEVEYCQRAVENNREQQWHKEAEEQARLLEASLVVPHPSPVRSRVVTVAPSGIGRTMWGISSKSLQIRDSGYVDTMANFPTSPRTVSDRPLSGTSQRHDTHSGASESSGGQRTKLSAREAVDAPATSPDVQENYLETPEEASENGEEYSPPGHTVASSGSTGQTFRVPTGSDCNDNRSDKTDLITEPVSPAALHIKEEK